MEKIIKRISSPENLNCDWNNLTDSYFQTREFLNHLHKYNPCSQRYYELYHSERLVAGTVVYTLKVDILTFANIRSPFKLQIIGIPASIAAPPMIGDENEFEYFLAELIGLESGLILGINFINDYLQNKVVNLRTLPTIIFKSAYDRIESYENSLRHPYRRRLRKIRDKFAGVDVMTSDCSVFSEEHYELYLQIMRKTTTKLETLGLDVFRYLPSNFKLTTYYAGQIMLCWYIVCHDVDVLTYFFGGMNYSLRDKYQSYNNNLLGILETAIDRHYQTIDFGQTAEIAKTRFGGELSERRMFIYHKNLVILRLFKLLRNLIAYTKVNKKCHIFKAEVFASVYQAFEF